jgi:hypothetical protein
MKTSKLAIRIVENPNHHLWKNNGNWWLNYTEYPPDYTNRRVRISLHTNNVRAARAKRAVPLSPNSTATSAPALQKAA